jgi:hypothetical protein
MKRRREDCPVKQKRALLRSNPPRDNWTEGDEINVSGFGEAKSLPKTNLEMNYFRAEHALKTWGLGASASESNQTKTNWISILSVSPESDIHAEPVQRCHP